jgi:protein-disulfide isomerase
VTNAIFMSRIMKEYPMIFSREGNSLIVIAVVLVAIGAAIIGYVGVQSSTEQPEPLTPSVTDAATDATPHSASAVASDPITDSSETHNTAAQPDKNALAPHPDDIVIGDSAAPVRIVEYASLSCPHCATMHLEIMPEIQSAFVDTGKAYIAFRHFPLNAPALRAAMAVQCAAPEKRKALLDTFFSTQKDWAFGSDYLAKIAETAAPYGLSETALDACYKDISRENAMLQSRQTGAALGVESTPTLFVGSTKLDGAVSPKIIADAIEAAVSDQNATKDGDKPEETTQE